MDKEDRGVRDNEDEDKESLNSTGGDASLLRWI